MVKNHACHALEPKYLIDDRIFKIIDESTQLLVMPNGREHKTNIKTCKTNHYTQTH